MNQWNRLNEPPQLTRPINCWMPPDGRWMRPWPMHRWRTHRWRIGRIFFLGARSWMPQLAISHWNGPITSSPINRQNGVEIQSDAIKPRSNQRREVPEPFRTAFDSPRLHRFFFLRFRSIITSIDSASNSPSSALIWKIFPLIFFFFFLAPVSSKWGFNWRPGGGFTVQFPVLTFSFYSSISIDYYTSRFSTKLSIKSADLWKFFPPCLWPSAPRMKLMAAIINVIESKLPLLRDHILPFPPVPHFPSVSLDFNRWIRSDRYADHVHCTRWDSVWVFLLASNQISGCHRPSFQFEMNQSHCNSSTPRIRPATTIASPPQQPEHNNKLTNTNRKRNPIDTASDFPMLWKPNEIDQHRRQLKINQTENLTRHHQPSGKK